MLTMMDKDQKPERNKKFSTLSNQEEDTLPLAQISNLEEMADFYREVVPERTFGYGESGKTSDLVDKTINRKYRIVDLIAEGSASNVFLCERIMVGDLVALKMLSAKLAADPDKSKRFYREAATTASIKHPNVIAVYDFDLTDEGVPFIVTELLRGLTLFGELKQVGRLPLRRAIQILTPICSALNVAHTRGIVHRDLKPSNIVLHRTDDGAEVAKLIDFGIAKQPPNSKGDAITGRGIIYGTPAYMSPENCLGEPLDSRSDIYALGIMLFEMLTGSTPFNAGSPIRLMVKHIKEEPPSLRDLCPEIPPVIEKIVLRALSKERETRFPTANDLADELNRALLTTWSDQ
jgi:eukaryotic-like serine/threonine-protein kinase